MNLLLLGATGGIGIELVRQALGRGHTVTAFVRSPGDLTPYATQISILQGDLLNAAQLADAMSHQHAVLSAFGPRLPLSKADANLLRDFASALVPAMQRVHVPRALIVSTAFLFKDALLPPAYLFGRLFFPGVVADATAMESILRASNLDITIVRPPQLTNRPHTGRFRVRERHLPRFGFSIPRADVADFMLQLAERDLFHRTIVGVST